MKEKRAFTDFRTFQRRLILQGALKAETALRVGTGDVDELSGADMAVMKDAQRRPFIPGSSFKGALRAHIERIVRTLCQGIVDERQAACDPLTEEARCIPATWPQNKPRPEGLITMQELREDYSDNPVKLAQAVGQHSCYVCRLFGSPWLASKALFKDLTLERPDLWFEGGYQVRAGVGIERDSGAAKEGVLYSSELVPPGTRFTWNIVIENADPVLEEPLLFLGLREMAHAHIPMGGGRSRGLGRVSLSVDKANVVDQATLKDYLISGTPASLDWDTLVAQIPPMIKALTAQEAAHA